jgi:hypothetical protein
MLIFSIPTTAGYFQITAAAGADQSLNYVEISEFGLGVRPRSQPPFSKKVANSVLHGKFCQGVRRRDFLVVYGEKAWP